MSELEKLEKEFVDFLVVNGITADDWEKLKREDPLKAEEIINQFSDVIWEGTLRKAEYITKYAQHAVFCFQCLPDKMRLIKVTPESEDELMYDFDDLKRAVETNKKLFVQRAEKAYQPSREREIYSMIEQGCEITDHTLFELLDALD